MAHRLAHLGRLPTLVLDEAATAAFGELFDDATTRMWEGWQRDDQLGPADIAKDRPRLLRVAGVIAVLEYGLQGAYGNAVPASEWRVEKRHLQAARVVIDYGSAAKAVANNLIAAAAAPADAKRAQPQSGLAAPEPTDAEQLLREQDARRLSGFRTLVRHILGGHYNATRLSRPAHTFMEFQKTYLKNTNISVREYFEGMLAQFPSLRCLLVVEEYANARNTNNNKASWRIRRLAPAVEASEEQVAEVIAALGEWHGGLSLDQHRQQVQLEEADFAALASLADDLAGAAMSTPAASHGHRTGTIGAVMAAHMMVFD
ncbi:hypothetical protein GPECTOR_62g927 [Gonium pectorale]|uniref:Uncharacterized protein n=1 Tax=Gonium pectorale TaxID=33097 RepID=A0A150G4M3_GONPE|nr:hypothetical protein GPECTOR_62g927 [Gonium pectorale]|eukprot:KXZ44812.1 hypothetical protein GPECTOR_62g927 [Gonium pectorale]